MFIVASLAIVVNQFVSDPTEAALGLGMVAIGAPIYYLWKTAQLRLRPMREDANRRLS